MAIRRKDNFNVVNGPLGTMWEILAGQVEVKDGRAYAIPSSVAAIAVVDCGLGGENATVSLDCVYASDQEGGHALYFRVADGVNWWCYSVRRRIVTTAYFQTTSGWTCDIYSNGSNQRIHTYQALSDESNPGADSYTVCHQNGYYYYVSEYYWTLSLQCYVNGSSVYQTFTDIPVRPDRLAVTFDEGTIKLFYNGSVSVSTFANGTHSEATKHGLGYSPLTDYQNTLGMDNFEASPKYAGAYTLAMMI